MARLAEGRIEAELTAELKVLSCTRRNVTLQLDNDAPFTVPKGDTVRITLSLTGDKRYGSLPRTSAEQLDRLGS